MKVAIIGAGIAGLSLCEWLLEEDCHISVFDSTDPFMGSDAPTVLFHPFPGRSLEVHPFLQEAVTKTITLLKKWQLLAPSLIRSSWMIRPLQGNNEHRLKNSFDRLWKNHSVDWVHLQKWSANKLRQQEPLFAQSCDALAYQPSYAIDIGELRSVLLQRLLDHKVQYHPLTISSIQKGKSWFLPEVDQHFDKIVLAVGSNTPYWFPELRITLQGGSLLQARLTDSPKHLLSVNGLHLGRHHSGDLVIGSTRWSTPPDKHAQITELTERLYRELPLLPTLSPIQLWSGLRCIYPSDRLPLCGQLPHCPNLYVLTALGSKGMLWGPLAAHYLRNNVCTGDEIPETFSLLRARSEDGWFSPKISVT